MHGVQKTCPQMVAAGRESGSRQMGHFLFSTPGLGAALNELPMALKLETKIIAGLTADTGDLIVFTSTTSSSSRSSIGGGRLAGTGDFVLLLSSIKTGSSKSTTGSFSSGRRSVGDGVERVAGFEGRSPSETVKSIIMAFRLILHTTLVFDKDTPVTRSSF